MNPPSHTWASSFHQKHMSKKKIYLSEWNEPFLTYLSGFIPLPQRLTSAVEWTLVSPSVQVCTQPILHLLSEGGGRRQTGGKWCVRACHASCIGGLNRPAEKIAGQNNWLSLWLISKINQAELIKTFSLKYNNPDWIMLCNDSSIPSFFMIRILGYSRQLFMGRTMFINIWLASRYRAMLRLWDFYQF